MAWRGAAVCGMSGMWDMANLLSQKSTPAMLYGLALISLSS